MYYVQDNFMKQFYFSIEQPHPAFKKKLKVSAPQYGQGKLSERYICSTCIVVFTVPDKLQMVAESLQ